MGPGTQHKEEELQANVPRPSPFRKSRGSSDDGSEDEDCRCLKARGILKGIRSRSPTERLSSPKAPEKVGPQHQVRQNILRRSKSSLTFYAKKAGKEGTHQKILLERKS
jgi:hypothetical protein